MRVRIQFSSNHVVGYFERETCYLSLDIALREHTPHPEDSNKVVNIDFFSIRDPCQVGLPHPDNEKQK